MAKAVGIGGVFLHFKGDKKAVMDWYEKNLGLDMSPYGTGFIEGEQLVLLSFKRQNPDGVYLNLRVDDIDEIFTKFVNDDIEIVSPVTEYDYGKFGQFKDPFGNIIELWEPYIEEYKTMVRKEIETYKKGNSDK